MTPEVEQAYKLFEELRDIEDEIYQLGERKNRVEYQLHQLITGGMEMKPHLGEKVRRGRIASENSSTHKIVALLNENPERAYFADNVANELAINIGTTRTSLSKLAGKNLIEKRSFNTYGAVRAEIQEEQLKEQTPTEVGV